MTIENYQYYNYKYKEIKIDPYRIMFEYKITHPAHQHALKKLLRCGKSIKEQKQDIKEVIDSLNRWLEMIEEDEVEHNNPKVIEEVAPPTHVEKQKVITCSTCKHDRRDGVCHKTTSPNSYDCWPAGFIGWEEKYLTNNSI